MKSSSEMYTIPDRRESFRGKSRLCAGRGCGKEKKSVGTEGRTKKKKWVHLRHRAVFAFLRPIMRVYTRLVYGYRAEPMPLEKGQAYLVVSNHQTGFDQFLIALSVKRPLYYIASDDIFNRKISKLIEYLVAPIPKSKSNRDMETIRNCHRIAKEGGTICVFPEGNRTFSGRTETMDPSIAKLARLLRLPIACYRFEGGYGVQPRWARKVRKGRMRGRFVEILPVEEWEKMTDAALFARIRSNCYRDENATEETYRSDSLAEYQERAFYYCPDCGGMGKWHSEGDRMVCANCGRTLRYTEHNDYEVLYGSDVLRTPRDWYDAQTAWCKRYDFAGAGDKRIFGGERVRLYESIRCQRKVFCTEGIFGFYADRIQVGETSVPLAEITDMTVLGKNKVNYYRGGKIFQIVPPARFCAVRLVNFYYSYRMWRGENEHEFMGL